MIVTQKVTIKTFGPSISYYRSLGYDVHHGTEITIPVEHLSRGSDYQVDYRCDRCSSEFTQPYNYKRERKSPQDFCKSCDRYLNGKKVGHLGGNKNAENHSGSNHYMWNSRKSEFDRYRLDVIRLTTKIYRKYKTTINPNNLPRKMSGTEGGYQLDHILSIKEGFDQGLSVDVIAHPANLQMVSWQVNITKAHDYRHRKINKFLNTTEIKEY